MSTASSTFPAFSSPHVLVCVRQNAWAAYAPAVIACMVSRGWTVSAALEAGKEPFIGMPLLQACGALPHMRCSAGDSGHVDVVICFAESEAETAESSRPGPGGSLRIPADCPRIVVGNMPGARPKNEEPYYCRPEATRTRLAIPAPWPARGDRTDSPAVPGNLCDALCDSVMAALTPRELQECNVLVTAGPTAEDLDPVRFLSNRSTGRMGLALARAAWRHGAGVELVHGPLTVRVPRLQGMRPTAVRSAEDMYAAVMKQAASTAVVIMCAAVADARPAVRHTQKLKKTEGGLTTLPLEATRDILAALGACTPRPFLVGFAAETRNVEAYAREKLKAKNCDIICANDVSAADSGFAVDTNRVTMYYRDGRVEPLAVATKDLAAEQIISRIAALIPTIRPR